MKKVTTTLMLVGAIVSAVSCSKSLEKTPEPGKTTVFKVSLAETKTHFNYEDGIYKLVWSENDHITVNGLGSSPIASEYVGTRSAEFTVPGELTPPYNILFGAQIGGDDIVFFPYRQSEETVGNAPMYASSETTTLENLTGLYAAVRFRIKSEGGETLQTIALHPKGGEVISGTFMVGKTGSLLNGVLEPSDAGDSSEWTAYSTDVVLTSEAQEFILNVPVGTYAQGFEAFINTSAPKQMTVSFLSSGKTLEPNKVYSLPELSFEQNTSKYVIATEEDLVGLKLLEGSTTANTDIEAQVVTDLDMSSKDYVTVTNYYGSLEGNNHKIEGLTTSLFGALYGPVSNLTLDADIKYAGSNDEHQAGTDYGVGILCHYVYAKNSDYVTNAAIDNVTTEGSIVVTAPTKSAHAFQIGGVTGASNGVPISNCTNKAAVTVTNGFSVAAHTSGTTEFTLHVGGVVGTCQTSTSASVVSCRNEGAVTLAASSVGETSAIGGVVGKHMYAAAVDKCTNAGKVLASSPDFKKSPYIGGVIGNNNGVAVVTNCLNEMTAEVLYTGTSSNWVSIGGVCGGNLKNGSRDNTNRGEVKAEDCTASYVFLGGVSCQVDGDYMQNLYNYGSLSMTNVKHTASTGISIGGVAAKCNTGNLLYSCFENHGSITLDEFNSDSTQGRYDIGGVIGYHQYEKDASAATFSLTGFQNDGDITVNSISTSNNVRVGGIVGNGLNHISGNTERTAHNYTLTYCTNEGDITLTAGENKSVQVGGILADARVSGTVTMTGCSNAGDIEVIGIAGKTADTNGGLCIGGVLGKAFSNYCTGLALSSCSNSGRIYLNEDTAASGTDSGRPCVGGIIGLVAATSSKVSDLTLSNCTNSGAICRTRASATKQTLDYNNYQAISSGGGIVGSIGFNHDGGMTYAYVNATIENCTNNGEVSFSRKRTLTDNVSTEKNSDGTGNYNGGILGQGLSSATSGIIIRSCVNNGPIKSTCGKDGGIIGFMRKGVLITGDVSHYTENHGQVHHQGESVEQPTGTPYGYCGGIAGYVFGDPSNRIEYAANYGFLASNYGAGGLVGLLASSTNPDYGYVKFCKVFCESHASSTANALLNGGKTALMFGDISSSTEEAYADVSDIAVGGAVYKYRSSAWVRDVVTADNYCSYLSALKYNLTTNEAAEKNIVYWDGTSSTAWE